VFLLDEVLSVENFVRVRQVMGGPGEKSIEEMLEKLRERIRRGERVIGETKMKEG
jgi:argininosuccinate lyase